MTCHPCPSEMTFGRSTLVSVPMSSERLIGGCLDLVSLAWGCGVRCLAGTSPHFLAPGLSGCAWLAGSEARGPLDLKELE